MTKILMIEDDLELAEILSEYLQQYDIDITVADDPFLGLSKLNLENFNLVILDLTLPGMDGLEVCKEIRKNTDIPIIISSARHDLTDKINAFDFGADDYLPKPYDPKEMYARIMSLIRRYKKSNEVQEEAVETLFRIDERRHEIYYNNESLTLTPAEYEILSYLIKQHSFSVSREQLVYNCKSLKDKDSKSLDVIIGRLRTKIGDSSKAPKHIFSVRGIGYKLIG